MRYRLEHRFAQPNLSAYLDGELSDDQRKRLERHLAACPACKAELASLRHTVALLRRTPVRPIPRSFTLPMTAQAEQARTRRWNLAYSYLRAATVAATFLLVILISGDALIGLGAIPIPDRAAPQVREVAVEAMPQAGAVEAVVEREAAEDTVEREVLASPPAAESSAPSTEALKAAEPKRALQAPTEPKRVLEAAAEPEAEEEALPSEPALSARGSGGPPAVAPEPETPSGEPGEQDTEKAVAIGLDRGPSPVGAADGHRPEPTPTAMPTQAPTSVAREQPVVTASPVPVTATREPSPAPPKEAAHLTEPVEGQARPGEPHETPPLSPMWTIWRGVRLLWWMLAGLLSILLAATIWAGRRRRP